MFTYAIALPVFNKDNRHVTLSVREVCELQEGDEYGAWPALHRAGINALLALAGSARPIEDVDATQAWNGKWTALDAALEFGLRRGIAVREPVETRDTEGFVHFKRVWVSEYRRTRCFGGTEEGGWYYDHDEFHSATLSDSIEEARCFMTNCRDAEKKDESVVFFIESFAGENQSGRRPHYC